MNNPHQKKRLDYCKKQKATPGRVNIFSGQKSFNVSKHLGTISSVQVGSCGLKDSGYREERGGICLMAQIMDLLSLCPAAMEQAQQLRVGKCVAATFGC